MNTDRQRIVVLALTILLTVSPSIVSATSTTVSFQGTGETAYIDDFEIQSTVLNDNVATVTFYQNDEANWNQQDISVGNTFNFFKWTDSNIVSVTYLGDYQGVYYFRVDY